jgi:SAM-dependent methyltransferase
MLEKEIKKAPQRKPYRIPLQSQFLSWHASVRSLSDIRIDRALGISPARTERGLNTLKLVLDFRTERLTYNPTPYNVIRDAMKALNPGPGEVFYDLGAGYGRVLFYGALTHKATFRGIEIVRDRVEAANRIKDKLAIKQLDFRQGNAQTADFSDGNLFFLFNPFFSEVLPVVGMRLRRIARTRQIRIASVANSNAYFATQRWLDEMDFQVPRTQQRFPYELRLFVSRV